MQFVRHLEGDRALDRIFQLPDIARPFVVTENIERTFIDTQDAAIGGCRVLLQEVIG